MALLFLIRHGLTAQTGRVLYGRAPGIPLDHRGRAQSEALVGRFEGVRLTAAYSSPLERCTQTLEPLASAHRLDVMTRDELIEMDAGSWTGKRLSAVRRQKAWGVIQREPSTFTFPGGGEGFVQARDRVVGELLRIAGRHPRGRVAVGTHGDIARIALGHFLGTPLDDFQRIVVDTASVSVLQIERGHGHVRLVNDTGGVAAFATAPIPPWETANRAELRG
ncbi:MAG: histidine phosphatase family protein [Actinomycetota bacterium]